MLKYVNIYILTKDINIIPSFYIIKMRSRFDPFVDIYVIFSTYFPLQKGGGGLSELHFKLHQERMSLGVLGDFV